jgi:protein ImuA
MSPPAGISALRDRIRQIERPARHGVLPFGVAAIDGALPGGGLALGAVHEIMGQGGDEEDGAAAAGFAAILARIAEGARGAEPEGGWASCCGVLNGGSLRPRPRMQGSTPRLVLVTAPRDDEIVGAEEGLRAGPAGAAVVGELGRLPMVAGRRLRSPPTLRRHRPVFALAQCRGGGPSATGRARR